MADILYVQDGYVANGYVVATRDASATLSNQATVTATATKIQYGSAQFECNISGLSWDEMGTWYSPRQEQWQDNFVALGGIFLGTSANLTAQGTVTATPRANFAGAVNLSGVLDATLTANTIASGIILKLGSASISASADRIRLSSAIVQGASTQTADASITANGQSDFVGSLTVTPTPIKTALGAAQFQPQCTVDTQGLRIKQFASDFTAQGTLTSDAIIVVSAEADFTASAQLSIPDVGIILTLGGRIVATSQASTIINGGLLAEGELILPFAASTLILGTTFVLDPYRIYTIPTESRINKIEQETRSYIVPSETRIYEIQHLKLVDEAGILDRREG